MKNPAILISIGLLFSIVSFSQVYMNLEDNMVIPSNSWIIINPGNYVIPDVGNDGLIQINDKENIIIDGDGVTVDGTNYLGYMIKIDNSSYIEIKNFDAVSHYYYAVYITNSDHISINGNDFSWNKVDSIGWISIWTNYGQALGGGVMMYNSHTAQVNDNNMKFQNDGVALYHCDSIQVHNNDFSWNTSFGIRMYFSDTCDIQNNNCSHVNRPYTDPSDCAAILLIVSNNNYVVNNDFSYSGDGIFLGQYQYSQILNNNYFAYNECSYSPHNAIEATFADGNVYEYNNCNYSHYGFWLGYSYNSIVRNNEIIGNQHSGIAIDRGFNNVISNNTINENPTGIELWEGDGIPPYQNQYSEDYYIYNNNIEGNTVAISLKETEHSVIFDNEFPNNRNGIYIFGDATEDTISSNVFKNTTLYHIENNSVDDIYAINNDYLINDESIIECKIYDKDDNPGYGEVIWQPYIPGDDPEFQYEYPVDMAEPDAVWYAYPEACWGYGLHEPTYVEWDYNEKVFGEASVHITTGNGWDIGALYRPVGDSIASWSLAEQDTLTFWLKSINNTGYGFQFCSVIIGNNCGAYYKYTASASTILNPTIGQWRKIDVPLAGVYPWERTAFGNISFDEIAYVEIHADTWEYGFELWIDAVTFNPTYNVGVQENITNNYFLSQNFPNPATGITYINFTVPEKSFVTFRLMDINGKTVDILVNKELEKGLHTIELDCHKYLRGLYFYQLNAGNCCNTKKLIIQ
ncbi:MAG: right-handed parallel beta-helix repeat-containing protein [Bacteroidales bacterium]|nr:right-handed parallel beta-helix repeat-containing protein [Bacteroidales bacterium]